MAPTRPLVAQQIEACHSITGIPSKDCVEITGKHSKSMRKELWQTKRVFFATPQTVQSDLNSEENFPFRSIRLVVVDEAHKAKGKYAYTEVIQAIASRNRLFRVLALSATPGRHIEDVVEVIKNLLISHVEIRWENSIDVAPYVHKRRIQTEVVHLSGRLKQIREEFIIIADKYVRRLYDNDAIVGTPNSLTKSILFMQHKRYKETLSNRQNPKDSQIMSDFSMAVSLFHALELLEKHGLRIFINYFDDESNVTKDKFFLAKDRALKIFVDKLREELGPNPLATHDESLPNGSIIDMPLNFDFGHPKFNILQKCLIDHFTTHQDSRVIVFCEYRDSVLLLYRLLLQNRPLIKPKIIVGKGGNTSGLKLVTEKQQKFVMQSFREGIVNTLIATCVAEEGIDVGEVDLIICFDISTKNPQRFVQRIGRTGRKREGKIIALVTEGIEQETLKEVIANKDKTNQKIVRNNEIKKNLYTNSPRLVPVEFNPKCIEVSMKVDDNETECKNISKIVTKKSPNKKRETKPKDKVIKGIRDVREYFKKIDPSQADTFNSPRNSNLVSEEDIIMLDSDDGMDAPPMPTVKTFTPVASTSKHVFVSNVSPHQNSVHHTLSTRKITKVNKNVPIFNEKPNTRSSTIMSKLISFQKNLNANKMTNPASKIDTVDNILNKSSNLSTNHYIQRSILKMHPDMIKFKMEAATILDNIKQRNGVAVPLPPHFEKLQSDVNRIEKIFNGHKNVENFLTKINYQKKYYEYVKSIRLSTEKLKLWTETVGFELGLEEYDNRVMGLKFSLNILKRDLYTQPELIENIPDETVFPEITENHSCLNTDQLYNHSNFTIGNYHSSFISNTLTPNSVPLTSNAISSSTPCNSLWEDSPMRKAFNNSISNRISSDTMAHMSTPQNNLRIENIKNCEIIKTTPFKSSRISNPQSWTLKSTLKYFLLNSLDEMFIDSKDIDGRKPNNVDQSNSKNSSLKLTIQPRKLFEPLESQATVTQILGQIESHQDRKFEQYDDKTIRDDRNNYAINSNHQNYYEKSTMELTKSDKRQSEYCLNLPKKPDLDLGDLDDIFGSDDDIFADCEPESRVNVELELSSPEHTQIYNFQEEINPLNNPQIIKKKSREKSSDIFDMSSYLGESDGIKSDEAGVKFENKCDVIQEENIVIVNDHCETPTPPPIIQPVEITSPSILFGMGALSRRIGAKMTNTQDQKQTPMSLTKGKLETRSPFFPPLKNLNITKNVFRNNPISPALSQLPVVKNRCKRFIESSDSSDSETRENNRPQRILLKQKRKRRRCEFVDDEAHASQSDSCEEFETQTQDLLHNSIIDNDFDERGYVESDSMRVFYLKSVKSPLNTRPGVFKIPDYRKYQNITNIFSQMPTQDESYAEKYDSFVVDEDEEPEVDEKLCPLERAEAMLNQKREAKSKRKIKTADSNRRKVIVLEDSSDEDVSLNLS